MGDLGETAATYVRGGFTYFVGNVLSFVVMAVGSILVARMLSPAEYGLYGVSMVLPQFFFLFCDWGINSALIRFLSKYRSEEKHVGIWRLNFVGLLFKVSVGVVLSLALFLSADFLSTVLLRRPGLGVLVRVASLLVLFNSLYSTVVAILNGLERMDLMAVVHVLMAVVKGVLSPLLVYMGSGVSGPLIGQVLSYIVASIIGLLLIVFTSPKPDKMADLSGSSLKDLRMMLGFGLPLFSGAIVAGFAGRLHGFLLSLFVTDEAFGNYHVAVNFSMLVSLLTGSILVTLFPAFSKMSHTLEPERTSEAFKGSVRYSAIIVVPLVFLLATVSEPAVYFLYTARYPYAPLFLSLMIVPRLLVGFGSLSIGNFLKSQGDTRTGLEVGLANSVVSILLSPVLIWRWGILGLLVSLMVSSFTGNVFGIYVLRKKYGFNPDFQHPIRTLLCSSVSAGISYGVIMFLPTSIPILSLLLGSAVFLVVFLGLAPFLGAITERDIVNLESMLSGLALISLFAMPLLKIEMKILGLTSKKKA